MRWTIAIPTFDGSRYLPATLDSLLGQTDRDFELLVCDDGSRDETLEIVKSTFGESARILTNTTGKPLGLAGNWNRCVAEASGDWITILHQDDLLQPEFLDRHRQVATIHRTVGLIIGPVDLVDETGVAVESAQVQGFTWPDRFVVWPPESLSRFLVKSNPIRCPGVSFRRDLHSRLGGFDARWKYVLDWDFWYRAGQAADVAVLAERLALQRWHATSETHRLARGTVDLEENARLMRSILEGPPFAESEKPLIETSIRERLARAWTNRAYQAACRGDRALELNALRNAWRESPGTTLRILSASPRTLARLAFGRRGNGETK